MKNIKSIIKESNCYYLFQYKSNCDKLKKANADYDKVLESYSPRPQGSIIAHDRLINIQYDCQIVLPVYNNELYIKECLDSILTQKTKYTYHIFCVNDGSTDHTVDILREYENDNRITIINQNNQGLSAARNAAMKEFVGKYIMFVDSDDILLPNAIEGMLSMAFNSDCDVLIGQYKDYDGTNLYARNIDKTNSVLFSDCGGFVWNKIYKYELFEHIQFPENYWWEDTIMSLVFFSNGRDGKFRKVCFSEMFFYGYRKNDAGLSKGTVGMKKNIDAFYITELCCFARADLGRAMDRGFLEKLERQIIANYIRIKKLPDDIQIAIFYKTQELINKLLRKYVINAANLFLIQSILQHNYGGYKYICQRGYEALRKAEKV